MANEKSILVIGVGNEFRGDDGAGLVAVRELRRHFGDGISVLEESGDGLALLDAWQGADTVVLIDAMQSGARPGTIQCWDANRDAIPRGCLAGTSHAFGVTEAIEVGKSQKCLPAQLVIYGIEGENFAFDIGLSPAVEAAVMRLTNELAKRFAAQTAPAV